MDWKATIDEAMQLETEDIIAAKLKYDHGVEIALAQTQAQIENNPEVAIAMEAIYGALIAHSQSVILSTRAEAPEIGGIDHAFSVGRAYGISCVINHLIDRLTDTTGSTHLAALDDFSDSIHNEILVGANAAGIIGLLDAKGKYED
jgi:hypothetical protein